MWHYISLHVIRCHPEDIVREGKQERNKGKGKTVGVEKIEEKR